MSKLPNIAQWKPIGDLGNSRYYEIADRIIAAVPRIGSIDDEASAKANVKFQHEYFERTAPGVIVIYFDNIVSQDKNARAVYKTTANPKLLLATALVGGSLLSRAMGSFFMGLSKPQMPIRMFGTTDEALIWAREQLANHDKESAQ